MLLKKHARALITHTHTHTHTHTYLYIHNCKNWGGEKDFFTERRPTVCDSNYRVVDCKVFTFSPTWKVAERNRAVLIDIGLAETVDLLL